MNRFACWSNWWFISKFVEEPIGQCYLWRPYLQELDDDRFRRVPVGRRTVDEDTGLAKTPELLRAECSQCPGVKFVTYALHHGVIVIPDDWVYSNQTGTDLVRVGVALDAITPSLLQVTTEQKRLLHGRRLAELSPDELVIQRQLRDRTLSETQIAYDLLRAQGWDMPPHDNPTLELPIDDLEMFYTDEIGFWEIRL